MVHSYWISSLGWSTGMPAPLSLLQVRLFVRIRKMHGQVQRSTGPCMLIAKGDLQKSEEALTGHIFRTSFDHESEMDLYILTLSADGQENLIVVMFLGLTNTAIEVTSSTRFGNHTGWS